MALAELSFKIMLLKDLAQIIKYITFTIQTKVIDFKSKPTIHKGHFSDKFKATVIFQVAELKTHMPMEMLKMIKRTFKNALGKHRCMQTRHFINIVLFDLI